MRLVLASGSPRRADLLRSVGIEFSVLVADIDETPAAGEPATGFVNRMANEKCLAVQRLLAAGDRPLLPEIVVPEIVVLAADTIVVIDGDILGKPVDDDETRRMLRRLSGRTHEVHTAVCVATPTEIGSTTVTTTVTFATLTEADIAWYIARGESLDKAGGYGMQTAGAVLVERIDGSPTNVIGLPLRETVVMLRSAGVAV
ncbi:MAG TPA: Maf family protein [Ilumatobacter sp.]|nr:Maf family protein [Ilumatobacter sp.]